MTKSVKESFLVVVLLIPLTIMLLEIGEGIYLLGAAILFLLLPIVVRGEIKTIVWLLALVYLSALLSPPVSTFASFVSLGLVIAIFIGLQLNVFLRHKTSKIDFRLPAALLTFAVYRFLRDLLAILATGNISIDYPSLTQALLTTFIKPFIPFMLVNSMAYIFSRGVPLKFVKHLEGIIIGGAVICYLLAIAQYLPHKPPFVVSILNWYVPPQHREYIFEYPLIYGYFPRVLGTFGNPNQLGTFSGLMLLYLVSLLGSKNEGHKSNSLLIACFVLSCVSLLLAQSRTAFAALFLILLFLFLFKKGSMKLLKISLIFILLVPLFLFPTRFIKFAEFIEQGLRHPSYAKRQELNVKVVSTLFENPLYFFVGGGIHYSRQTFPMEETIGVLDNEYTRTLAAYGLVGLLLMLYIFVSILGSLRNKLSFSQPWKEFIIGATLFMLITCLTGEILSADKTSSLFFFLVSFVLYSRVTYRSRAEEKVSEKQPPIWKRL